MNQMNQMKIPFALQGARQRCIAAMLCVLFIFFGCGMLNDNESDSLDDSGNQFSYINSEGKTIALKLLENKMFLQFAKDADREQLLSVISEDVVLQQTCFELGYWDFYFAVLEAKDGKPIPIETLQYFRAKDEVDAVSYVYSRQEALQETFYGLSNKFFVTLKDETSYEILKQLAEQNHCIVGESFVYAPNLFPIFISETSEILNAFEVYKLFLDFDLFEYVEPYPYTINVPWYQCDSDVKRTIEELKGETAFVRKDCLAHMGEKYYFELVNNQFRYFVPIDDIPEKYMNEGMKVIISGSVINCWAPLPCFLPPYARVVGMRLFELKSIK